MPRNDSSPSSPTRWSSAILSGFLAAALVGILDAVHSLRLDTLPVSGGRAAQLLILDALAMGVLTLGPLVVLVSLVRQRRDRFLSAWWGMALAVLAVGGERWFTKPPPHTEVHPLQGALWVYALVAMVLLLAGPLLARWAKGVGRVGLAGLFLIAGIWVGAQDRALPPAGQSKAASPDVVLITIDTMRADHVGSYGNQTIWTPTLDGLAEAGARFENASAQIAVTGPSHITMFSGQGPWDHGVLLNGIPVPEGVGWLPESLRSAGYRTGAFVSAYVLDASQAFARGFDVYDDDFGILPGWSDTGPGRIQAMVQRKLDPVHVLERRGEDTIDKALQWRQTVEDGPVFLWVHLFDPHGPYTPAAPWDDAYYEGDPTDSAHTSMSETFGIPDYMLPSMEGITDAAWVRAQYAGEVSVTDQAIGRLLESLPGADDAVVIVVGDHGESLGEHGTWFHHGGDLQSQELLIPMFIRYPKKIPAGVVVKGPVELTDLSATIAELVGIPAPSGGDGRSLVGSTMTGKTPRPWARGLCLDRPANIAARQQGLVDRPTFRVGTVRGDNIRLMSRDAPGGGVERWEWRQGREVSVPISILGEAPRPEIQAMLDQVQALVKSDAGTGVERDEETMMKLRALGYVE